MASQDEDETTASPKEGEGEAVASSTLGEDDDDDDDDDDGKASEKEEFIGDEGVVPCPSLRLLKSGRDTKPSSSEAGAKKP